MKNSITYRNAVRWNTASRYYGDNFKQFYANDRKDVFIKQLDLNAIAWLKRKATERDGV